jgi:hypothetical protein
LTGQDLAKCVSKYIESERKSWGVDGILFRCYVCPACGQESLFVDLHPLEGETPEAFRRRRDELEETIRQAPHGGVHIALVDRPTAGSFSGPCYA